MAEWVWVSEWDYRVWAEIAFVPCVEWNNVHLCKYAGWIIQLGWCSQNTVLKPEAMNTGTWLLGLIFHSRTILLSYQSHNHPTHVNPTNSLKETIGISNKLRIYYDAMPTFYRGYHGIQDLPKIKWGKLKTHKYFSMDGSQLWVTLLRGFAPINGGNMILGDVFGIEAVS